MIENGKRKVEFLLCQVMIPLMLRKLVLHYLGDGEALEVFKQRIMVRFEIENNSGGYVNSLGVVQVRGGWLREQQLR